MKKKIYTLLFAAGLSAAAVLTAQAGVNRTGRGAYEFSTTTADETETEAEAAGETEAATEAETEAAEETETEAEAETEAAGETEAAAETVTAAEIGSAAYGGGTPSVIIDVSVLPEEAYAEETAAETETEASIEAADGTEAEAAEETEAAAETETATETETDAAGENTSSVIMDTAVLPEEAVMEEAAAQTDAEGNKITPEWYFDDKPGFVGWYENDAGELYYGINLPAFRFLGQRYYNNGWHWIDTDNDNLKEGYYFGSDGVMLANTTTPDGYTVDENGRLLVNGTTASLPWDPSAYSGTFWWCENYSTSGIYDDNVSNSQEKRYAAEIQEDGSLKLTGYGLTQDGGEKICSQRLGETSWCSENVTLSGSASMSYYYFMDEDTLVIESYVYREGELKTNTCGVYIREGT